MKPAPISSVPMRYTTGKVVPWATPKSHPPCPQRWDTMPHTWIPYGVFARRGQVDVTD